MSQRYGQDFASVAVEPARLGYKGEIAAMVERNMNLVEAADFHLANWGYDRDFPLRHEGAGHLPLGVMRYLGHPLMDGRPYQNSWEAEGYAIAIQHVLAANCRSEEPEFDKNAFIDDIQQSAKNSYVSENITRIKAWLLGQVQNVAFKDVFGADGITDPDFGKKCTAADIFTVLKGNSDIQTRTISSPEATFIMWNGPHDFSVQAPQGVATDFLFHVPTRERAGQFYDALKPALELFVTHIHRYREIHPNAIFKDSVDNHEYDPHEVAIYSKIRMQELRDVLAAGMKTKLAPKKSAGPVESFDPEIL